MVLSAAEARIKELTQFEHQGRKGEKKVEVTNRLKGLDLIECIKNYGWRFITLYRRQ